MNSFKGENTKCKYLRGVAAHMMHTWGCAHMGVWQRGVAAHMMHTWGCAHMGVWQRGVAARMMHTWGVLAYIWSTLGVVCEGVWYM